MSLVTQVVLLTIILTALGYVLSLLPTLAVNILGIVMAIVWLRLAWPTLREYYRR